MVTWIAEAKVYGKGSGWDVVILSKAMDQKEELWIDVAERQVVVGLEDGMPKAISGVPLVAFYEL